MSTTLIATKFCRPPRRANLVPRPRLLGRLDDDFYQADAFARKLTLVSAPAGYGKTSLLAEWMQSKEQEEAAWFLLDETDNDPRRFTAGLIAAMGQIRGGIGHAAAAMLQTPQPPASEVVLTALVNEIAADPRRFILILDDYQVIRTPAVHQQIAFILEHQGANFHLVLATREDPLLPIPRLRARGQVLEIRQDDLRFTAAETAEFLGRVMGLSVSAEETAALERRTEGWIAGLQLAALSLRGRDDIPGFIRAFTGSSRFILDYLMEEVIEQQPPDVKDFLLKSSVLERLSGALCDAVAERTASRALIESLVQANLFIVPLDPGGDWYRYHHLFAELLRHRLRDTHPEWEAALHRRAADWFEAQGLEAEAIRHALAAQDWRKAGTLIRRISPDLLKRGEVLTLIGWFEALPEDVLRSDPALCFDYCWPLLLAGRYDTAAPLLDRVEKAAGDHPAFRGEVFAAQAYLARSRGDHERMVERSRQALELLPKQSRNSRGIVAMNLGLAYWHMGRMRDAEEVLAEALDNARAEGNQYGALTCLVFLGRVCAVRGELRRAEEQFREAVRQGGDIPVNALAFADLAALQYEWNELEDSDALLQKALELCRRSQNDEFLLGCWMLVSRLRIAQGDSAGSGEALEQAWALVRGGRISDPMAKRVDAAQAYWLASKGEPTGEWGSRLTETSDAHPFYRFLGVTKARCMPESMGGSYLEELSRAARENGWGYGLVAIRALQTVKAETREQALEYLEDALRLAESGGFVRSFAEAGDKIMPLLREAAERGILPEYADRILAAMEVEAGKGKTGTEAATEPLSERELEVLRLVAAGLSNREIAEKLVISPGTAKTHIHNVCGKLGVRNRTEAAIKAKEMRLA